MIFILDLSSPQIFTTRSPSDFAIESSTLTSESERENNQKLKSNFKVLTCSASIETVKLPSFWDRNSKRPIWARNTIASLAKSRSKSANHLTNYNSETSSLDLTMDLLIAKRLAQQNKIRRRRIRELFRPDDSDTDSPSTSQIEDDEEEQIHISDDEE